MPRFLLSLFLILPAAASARNARLSLRGGAVEGLQAATDLPRYAPYAEVEGPRPLPFAAWNAVAFEAALFGGYWRDGMSREGASWKDASTCAYRAMAGGARLRRRLERAPLAASLSAGMARQFVAPDYVGGNSHPGIGEDHQFGQTLLEAGLQLSVPLGRVRITGEVQGEPADERVPRTATPSFPRRPHLRLEAGR